MNHEFAKLFILDNERQVLALLDTNADEGPEVRFYARPVSELIGLCNIGVTFELPEEAQEAFDKFDEDRAQAIFDTLQKQADNFDVSSTT